MRSSVIVLGSINTDLVVKVPRLPRPGETVIGGTFYKNQGGKGANQAVAAARAGGRQVVFIGAVGDDSLGEESVASLRRESIDTRYILRKPGVPSGVALIIVDEGGENAIAVASGANALLSPDDVEALPDEVFTPGGVLLACLEIPVTTVEAGLRRAKSQGMLTILNPAPAPPHLPQSLLESVDVITPNEHEASQITGLNVLDEQTARRAAEKLLFAGIQHVVLTLGSQGCLYMHGNTVEHVPAFSVAAVDTTAAGDAFNGALAVALSEQRNWPDALRWASAAAAISVTRPGAQPSLPRCDEIEEFLRGHC